MYCKLTHLRRITLISLTQSNGLMAASLLFPNKSCTRLNGLGQVLLLQQCRKSEIQLSAIETKCGYEPKFENYTVARDGYSLIPFQPCMWSDGIINVNNKAYT